MPLSTGETVLDKSWERRESNPGPLGAKRERYPLCYVPPPPLNGNFRMNFNRIGQTFQSRAAFERSFFVPKLFKANLLFKSSMAKVIFHPFSECADTKQIFEKWEEWKPGPVGLEPTLQTRPLDHHQCILSRLCLLVTFSVSWRHRPNSSGTNQPLSRKNDHRRLLRFRESTFRSPASNSGKDQSTLPPIITSSLKLYWGIRLNYFDQKKPFEVSLLPVSS